MNKPRRIVALLIVTAVIIGGALFTGAPDPTPNALAFRELTLQHPQSVRAGETFDVVVTGAENSAVVELIVDAGYGPRRFVSTSVGERAYFSVPGTDTPGSGAVSVEAMSTSGHGYSSVEFTPGSAVPTLELFLGPRTLEAGGSDIAMIVAVPEDERGNPVARGTRVDVMAVDPTGAQQSQQLFTSGLLAAAELDAGTVAGRNEVSVVVGEATGPERTFDTVAALAEPFMLIVDGPGGQAVVPPANGQDLLRLVTGELVDRFGNRLPDGTIGHLEVHGVTGSRRIPAATIDGRLTFIVEAPSRPGGADFVAFASGAQSTRLSLEFESAVSDAPLVLTPADQGVIIEVGPILATNGAFVPDGTEVTIRVDDENLIAVVDSGFASVLVESAAEVSAQVLGFDAVVTEAGS